MQMWLTRPREFEKLDQAINDACCEEDLAKLQEWADRLDQVVTGNAASGIGTATGAFPTPGAAPMLAHDHFYRHWVGDSAANQAPLYWPYAWGRPPYPASERLLIDRLVSAGLQWSILKVIASRQISIDDRSNKPACSDCRTHVTVWVCYEVTEDQKRLAAADLNYRRSLFRVGVIESRDAVVLVIQTPRPIELTGGVCDDTKEVSGGHEQLFREPVIVTSGFTDGETPKWTQPISGATSGRGSGSVGPVESQPLPGDGFMPAGTYPPDADIEPCVFVPLATTFRERQEATPSDVIKAVLRQAVSDYDLDLSDNVINRLRFTIEDETIGPG
jgi:hypothetical protein